MQEFKTKKELYKYIWDTREHVSELTDKPLLPPNHIQHHWQYLHILSHGTYPKYKFNPKNIMLALPEEHENQEQYEVFQEKQLELKRQYYKEFYNKKFD